MFHAAIYPKIEPVESKGSRIVAKSLRDQLVASGLATASQAKKAENAVKAEKQAHRKRTKKGQPPKEESLEVRLRRAKAAKAKRDKELAEKSNSKAAERARRAEIKQLIVQHDQRKKTAKEDDVPYNFRHNKKIKRIYVPKQQLDQLSSGQLVIVNNDGNYHLVAKDIADRIAERDPRWIVTRHDDAKAADEMDDYYKKFEVPDDLDW